MCRRITRLPGKPSDCQHQSPSRRASFPIQRDPMVSLLVPTLNRPEFVIRLLRYYADAAYSGAIYIGDSSTDAYATPTQEFVAALDGRLRVEYRRCPGCDAAEAMLRIVSEVTSRYVAFLGDDDFLVP